MKTIARLKLGDLAVPPCGVATPAWEVAIETLQLSLVRHRVAIVELPANPSNFLHDECFLMLERPCKPNQPRVPLSAPSEPLTYLSELLELPGLSSASYRHGGRYQGVLMEVMLDKFEAHARVLLAALCRSNYLRLRSDALTPFLDDVPLPANVLGSSRITLREHVNNFAHSPALDGLQRQPGAAALFPDPQEEISDAGILSLFMTQEAAQLRGSPGGGPRSMLQVRSASGEWQAVPLGPREMAVVLGHTAQRVTCGLVAPSCRRVVGDPYGRQGPHACSPRRELHYELRMRPSAVPDLRPALEAAGHVIPSRYTDPAVSVRAMMESFGALMSPAPGTGGAGAPGSVENLAALHASAVFNSREAGKRGRSKRRSCVVKEEEEAAAAQQQQQQQPSGPVTRSGRARRSAEGAQEGGPAAPKAGDEPAAIDVNMECDAARRASGAAGPGTSSGQQQQQQQQQQPPSTSRVLSDTLRAPGAAPLLHLHGDRTCQVLDHCLADSPSHCLGVAIRSFTGVQRWYYLNRALPIGRVFEAYCDRMGVGLGAVKFLLKGTRIFGSATPAALGLVDGAELTAVPESMDRLQQARELGPIFSSIFDVKVERPPSPYKLPAAASAGNSGSRGKSSALSF